MMNAFISHKDIYSIVIAFGIQPKKIRKVLNAHKKNFYHTIIVNNSPKISLEELKSTQVTIINNSDNIGLSKALNIGIQEAKKRGAMLIALFDQDTLINNLYNQIMLSNINNLADKNIALYSSLCFNHSSKNYLPLYYVYKFYIKRLKANKAILLTYPDFVITSGSYIPISAIEDIGLMDENLFINYIDIEWCFRARSKGYKIVNFFNCQIEHFIGDYSIKVFGYSFPIHSPLRLYYTFRNSIYCYSLRHIPLVWKFYDFFKNILRFLFYMLFVKNRLNYFKKIIKGSYHGLQKKMCKLHE